MGWFRKGLNAEPAMMMATVLAIGSLALPLTVPAWRQRNGYHTYQYYATADSHPMQHDYAMRGDIPDFQDADKLAAYKHENPYRYSQE